MFLFQILSRLVYGCAACMLRGTFRWVTITLKHTALFTAPCSDENNYSQIPFKNNHFENTK